MGQLLKLKTDGDEQLVQGVVGHVEKKLADIQGKVKSSGPLTVALLACLNVTEDYFRYRMGKEIKSHRAGKKITDLIKMIDTRVDAL